MDVDGDSVDELVYHVGGSGLWILRRNATTLTREVLLPSSSPAELATASQTIVNVAVSADLDGVNGPDFVYSYSYYVAASSAFVPGLAVHLRSANGLFDTAAVELLAGDVVVMCGCDVTASGSDTMFVAPHEGGSVPTILYAVRLSGVAEVVYKDPRGLAGCVCGNLYFDGRNQLLVRSSNNVTVLSFSGTEVSASTPPTATDLVAVAPAFSIRGLFVYDVDGDEDADLVVRSLTKILVFFQATSGAFLSAPYDVTETISVAPAPPTPIIEALSRADVNRDGTLDLVALTNFPSAQMISFVITRTCSADVRTLANGGVVVQDASGIVNSGTPAASNVALFSCTGNSTLFGPPNATCLASGVWSSDALCLTSPSDRLFDEVSCVSGCLVTALEDESTTNTTARAIGGHDVTTRTLRARVATRVAADSVIIVLESSAFALRLNKPWVVTLGGDAVLYTISGSEMTLEITAAQMRAHTTAGSPMALVVASPRFGYAPQTGGLIYVEFPGAAGCLTEGLWYTDNACRACPTGAFCPGGSRIWPRAGYWAPNERTQPVECSVKTACCGAIGERADVCPVRDATLGVRDTARCDTSAGFSGVMCADCEPGFVRDTAQCRRCDATTTASGEFAGLVLTALVVLGVFFVGLTVAPTAWFVRVVSLMIMFQSFVLLGRQVSARVDGRSGERLAATFRVLSIVLLDVEFFKPGCFVSRGVRYVDLLYGQLAMALIGLAVAAVAACAHALVLRARGMLDGGFGRAVVTRFELAAFSLAAFLVQVNAVRAFQGVACVSQFGSRWLFVERSTRCYEGDHARAAPAIWALLVFTVAFPIGCGALLLLAHRRQRAGVQATGDTKAKAGAQTTGDQPPAMPMSESLAFLLRSVRPERFWFRLIPMVATIVLAALVTNIAASSARVFAGATIVLANAALVVALVPFKSWRANLMPIVNALATGVQVVVILFVESASETTVRLRGALIALTVALAITALARLVLGVIRARKAKADVTSADVELSSASASADVELPSASASAEAELPSASVSAEAELSSASVSAEAELPSASVSAEAELPSASASAEAELSSASVSAEAELSSASVSAEAELSSASASADVELQTVSSATASYVGQSTSASATNSTS